MKTDNNLRPIIALETTNDICSVCIYYNDEHYYLNNIMLKNSHSEKIYELIESVRRNANLQLEDLDCVVVSEGPGSFTGLRIGYAAAKAIAFSSNFPFAPVPTFEAAALQVSSYLPSNVKFGIVSKVNIDDIYIQKFISNGAGYQKENELEIKPISEVDNLKDSYYLSGNLKMEGVDYKNSIPDSLHIAKWFIRFGNNLKHDNFDYLEPNYFKKFEVKERTKK